MDSRFRGNDERVRVCQFHASRVARHWLGKEGRILQSLLNVIPQRIRQMQIGEQWPIRCAYAQVDGLRVC